MTALLYDRSSDAHRTLKAQMKRMERQVVEWRRHLHRNPEPSFEEFETVRFIRGVLEEAGCFLLENPTPTSLVAVLNADHDGPTVAVRSDHDALMLQEETGLEFASQRPGVMHACGHDGHTAMALGAALSLAEVRQAIPGRVKFVFQHAEETLPGGASQLISAGVMEDVDRVIGMHLSASGRAGDFVIRPGEVMAACDLFSVRITGKGGHISAPHEAVDPIAIGALIVNSLQQLTGREVPPQEAAVVAVTGFRAGEAQTVRPTVAEIVGGTNTFSRKTQDLVERRIGEIAHGIALAHGADCEYTYTRGYASVQNDPRIAKSLAGHAETTFGADRVSEGELIMGGEDFSAYLDSVPGAFIILGAQPPNRTEIIDHHHPKFDVNEDAFPSGVQMLVDGALLLLEDAQ